MKLAQHLFNLNHWQLITNVNTESEVDGRKARVGVDRHAVESHCYADCLTVIEAKSAQNLAANAIRSNSTVNFSSAGIHSMKLAQHLFNLIHWQLIINVNTEREAKDS
jgi:hypothetical protein